MLYLLIIAFTLQWAGAALPLGSGAVRGVSGCCYGASLVLLGGMASGALLGWVRGVSSHWFQSAVKPLQQPQASLGLIRGAASSRGIQLLSFPG